MGRARHRLSAIEVKKAVGPSVLQDGAGLMLRVNSAGTKAWVLRTQVAGRRRDVGLGGYPAISLEHARTRAQEARQRLKLGEEFSPTKAARLARRADQVPQKVVTFRKAFEDYFELKRKSLSNGKHVWQWTATMEAYAFPKFGDKAVAEVTPAEVIAALAPIWHDKQETARRTLMRIRNVFDASIVQGIREKANPCTGVEKVLGTARRKVDHHKALPWSDLPQFVADLHARSDRRERLTRLLMEWAILHASRPGEARGALWCEVDLDARTWTIPGDDPKTGRRMKGGETHIVPLSDRAIAILEVAKSLAPNSDLIFPSYRGTVVSDMTMTKLLQRMKYADRADAHGFRSTFKDWCADHGIRDEVSEVALAHKDSNKVRRAYRRTDYLEERRQLMQRWSEFATSRIDARLIPGAISPKPAVR